MAEKRNDSAVVRAADIAENTLDAAGDGAEAVAERIQEGPETWSIK